jgi:putative phage-type endonuclease
MKANAAQESDDWLAQRAGCFTASRASDLMAKLANGKPAAGRANLIALLAVERVMGACVPTFQSAAMARGIEMEAEARDAYSFAHGVAVDECGFIPHPTIPHCGASPDGLLGDEGILEIKCPSSFDKHLAAIRTGAHAKEYRWQLQHQLFVTGRRWVEAVSYDPRWPEELQLVTVRVERDEKAIEELAAAIDEAEAEVSELVAELNDRAQKVRGGAA